MIKKNKLFGFFIVLLLIVSIVNFGFSSRLVYGFGDGGDDGTGDGTGTDGGDDGMGDGTDQGDDGMGDGTDQGDDGMGDGTDMGVDDAPADDSADESVTEDTDDTDGGEVVILNSAPTLSGLPDLSVNEDNSLINAFDLDNFASDLEGDVLSYSVDSNPNVQVTINSNNEVSFVPVQNFNGIIIITFTVSDNEFIASDSMILTVNPINDNPVLNIPDVSFNEDTSFNLNLNNYVSDLDISTNNDRISWTVSGNNLINVVISPTNVATFTPAQNFNGQETMIFTATDLAGASAVDSVRVTVNPINDNPILNLLGLSFVLSGDGRNEAQVNLDNFASDVDIATNNDRLSYSSEQNPRFNVNIQNNLARIRALNAAFTNGMGTLFDGIIFNRVTERIRFTATDLAGASDSDEVTIVIGNAPHAIISYNTLNVMEGQQFELSAERSFDLDGQIVSYLWDLGDGTTSTAVKLKHSYDNDGKFTVRLTVTDNDGLTDSQSITFNSGIELTKQHKFAMATKISDYNVYSPGDEYENFIKLRNIGNLKERGIEVKLVVPSLNVYEVLATNLNLDPYQVKWVDVKFKIPEDAVKGEHLARIVMEGKNYDTAGYMTFLVE